jgi:hypothetical protein
MLGLCGRVWGVGVCPDHLLSIVIRVPARARWLKGLNNNKESEKFFVLLVG